MKKGCLFFIVVFIAFSYLDWMLIKQYHADWSGFVSLVGGFLVAVVFANVGGLYTIFRQKRALNRPQNTWKEGMFVGVSGRATALRSPLESPISGRSVVLYEYDIKRTTSSGDSTSTVSDYLGFGMAPCGVQTQRGSVRLVGFPILAHFPTEHFSEDTHFERLARYLESAPLTKRSKGIVGALKQINEVLKDADGDVRLDLIDGSSHTDPKDVDSTALDADLASDDLDEGDEIEEGDDSEADHIDTPSQSLNPPSGDRSPFVQRFMRQGYALQEQVVVNGAQVTAFGTYHTNPPRLDVGGMLDTLSHSLFPGPANAVVGKNIFKSLIALVIWGAITAAAHWFTFPEFFQGLVQRFQ